jgi:Concanavalin A-like lectin/glucanases superfamily/Putative Ig domain/Bacterial Ig domain/Matrixin
MAGRAKQQINQKRDLIRLSRSPCLLLTSCLLFAANINPAQAVPTVSATETAAFPNHGDAYARVNDIITYTVTISDSGTDATGVQFSNPTPANTSDVAGSLNATPVAVDDTYPQTVLANMTVNTATSGFSVVSNDFAGYSGGNPVAAASLTITAFDATSLNGGAVTMTTSGANVGRFTYTPAPGFTGTDSFNYTISNGVSGTPAGSATAKVTITVSGPVIWFVDSTAPGGGNGTWTGTNAKAFQTIAQADAVDAANHRIFVLNNSVSSINYGNAITLNTGEWLIGQGAINSPTNTFDALMGISPGTDTPARPSIGGVRPTIAVSSGTGVTLASGNTVRGLNVTNSNGSGISGGAVGTLTLADFNVTVTGGTALSLTTSGTATATGTNNLSATTGTALNVANTTIGASGLNFQSISANGAVNGIVLNTTGTSGGLTVTGNGGTCSSAADCTGGAIQNSTGSGILFTSTASPSLTRLNLTDSAGGAADDGIVYTNVTGTVTIDTCAILNSPHNGVTVDNFNTNMTGFAMSNSTVSCAAGQPCQPSGSIGNDAVFVRIRGTSVLTSGSVTNSTFSGVRATGLQVFAQDSGRIGSSSGGAIVSPVASNSFTVSGSTFTNNGNAIDFSQAQVANFAFQILSNNITGTRGNVINAFSAAGSDTGPTAHAHVGKIDSNFIGTQGTKDSGSVLGNGIRAVIQGQNTQGSITISNNTVREVPNAGNGIISLFGQDGAATTPAGTSARFNVTSNTLPQNSGTNQNIGCGAGVPCTDFGIFVLADQDVPVCANITGNTIYDVTTGAGGVSDVYLAERAGPPAGAQLTIQGSGASTTFINANNTLTGASKSIDEGGNTTTVASCGTFPLLLACRDELAAAAKPTDIRVADVLVRSALPKVAAQPPVTEVPKPSDGYHEISQPELDQVVAASIAHWSATGLKDNQLEALRALKFTVAELPRLHLGEANGNQIRLDRSASGSGWSLDETVISNRVDLLTAIMHEMGHALGLPDTYSEQDRDNIMYGYLTKGERRLPMKDQAKGVKPNRDGVIHFLGSPVVIGTLPAGKSVKITFQNTITAAVPTITSQGTVSGTNFSSILTDDPGVGGASDPTVVPVAFPPTSFSAASPPNGKKNTVYAGYTFVANGNPAPTYTMQSGTFPPGLSLSSAGALTGTPTSSGLFSSLVVRASNVAGFLDSASFSITINEPPTFTSASSTTFTVGTNGSFQLTASGYPTTFTFTNTGNSLPSGVTLTSAGLLSGTPAAGTGGSYSLTFQADNGISPAATQSFTLTVNQAPAITSASSTTFTVGTAGTFTATATGYPPPTFSETGALPGGVTLSSGGVLSGTPNADTDGSYPFTLKASNGVGTDATQSFTLTVNPVTCTPAPANMISWWPGDGNASDLVGGHDGTLGGGATANATGEVDKAFQFQGTTEVVTVPNSSVYDFGTNPFTIDTWVKFTSVSGSDVFVAHDEGTGFFNKWIFWLKSGNLAMQLNGPAVGGQVDFGVPFAPTTGVWYHVAVTRSGSTYKFYVNGAQISPDQTNAATFPPANAPLTLGKAEALASLNGYLDEVEIFSRALTGPELAGIYYAGRFGKCTPPLQLSSAVSEKTHGGAGTFDVPLPLTGPLGIECRSGPVEGEHKLVFTFSNAVVSGNASVFSGTGSVSGSPTFAGKTMSVNLTGVTNAQQITVKLSGVTDAVAQVLADTTVSMNVLLGDVNANRLVNSTDTSLVQAQSGQPVSASNFRKDVNANGLIDSTDTSIVQSKSGTGF